MKGAMHYIWQNRLLPKSRLITTGGEQIDVISTGEECGQDNLFRNATLKIGGKELSGDIMLHNEREKENNIGDNVILHITRENDSERILEFGETIPHLCIPYPEELDKEFLEVSHHSSCFPCEETIARQSTINTHSFLSRLLIER
ncbi:MAG: DUF2851 family protein, partial [Bacteroidaceae bacterium]|nr:DUF2851 family protein [Bacteroidaceae bacterium]